MIFITAKQQCFNKRSCSFQKLQKWFQKLSPNLIIVVEVSLVLRILTENLKHRLQKALVDQNGFSRRTNATPYLPSSPVSLSEVQLYHKQKAKTVYLSKYRQSAPERKTIKFHLVHRLQTVFIITELHYSICSFCTN